MLDVFQGMTLQRAIVNSLTFAILEVGEWIIILLFLFIIFLEASESFRKREKDIKGSLSKGSLNFDISIDCICLVGMDHSFDNRIADDERLP